MPGRMPPLHRRFVERNSNARNQAEAEGCDRGTAIMNILYINLRGFFGETGHELRTRGHSVVLRSECGPALELIRNGIFDAVVIEDGNQDPQILHFTVEAHQSQPALPIFVADTWGRGLLRAIEQFGCSVKACGNSDAEFGAVGQTHSMHTQEFGKHI